MIRINGCRHATKHRAQYTEKRLEHCKREHWVVTATFLGWGWILQEPNPSLPWSCRNSTRIPRARPAPGCPSAGSAGSPGPPGAAARPLPINSWLWGWWHHVSVSLRFARKQLEYIYKSTFMYRRITGCWACRMHNNSQVRNS